MLSFASVSIRALHRNTHQRVHFLQHIRAMSSTTDSFQKFFVYAPDSTKEGTLATRYQVRGTHLSNLKPLIDNRTVQVGGMLTTPESANLEGTDKKAVGSILIVKAKTLDEVKALIESDIYYTSGVWDNEKLVILPFFSATPFPE
ncbi:hypothetical protein AX16_010598 [Volvariella volvacea WC 439]|nr:hypothetical protein AX16_010598 [Volvariella volvacea WC 439]